MASKGQKIATGAIDFMNGMTKGSGGFRTNKAINKLPKTIKSTVGGNTSVKMGKQLRKNKSIANVTQSSSAKAGNFFGQGIRDSYKNIKAEQPLGAAIKSAHTNKATGQLSAKKMAGTAATLGVAGRVATGGGLYRDRYGNVNVPGVPFI